MGRNVEFSAVVSVSWVLVFICGKFGMCRPCEMESNEWKACRQQGLST